MPLDPRERLYNFSVFFIDDNTGWAVFDSTIIKTIDGGANWQQISVPGNGRILSIFFVPYQTPIYWLLKFSLRETIDFIKKSKRGRDTYAIGVTV